MSLSFWNETSQGKKFAIQNISFEVKKGQKIALCGRTGSGKTTILNCLLKLYEISSGQIKLFGLDINELSKKKIRSSIVKTIFIWLFNRIGCNSPIWFHV